MKKSELIQILNNLPGNPEVKLWDVSVGDWVNFDGKALPLTLVKRAGSKGPWEVNQFVTEDDIKAGLFKARKVYALQSRKKGMTTYDRLGTIRY